MLSVYLCPIAVQLGVIELRACEQLQLQGQLTPGNR
jgi:hypothetical protein